MNVLQKLALYKPNPRKLLAIVVTSLVLLYFYQNDVQSLSRSIIPLFKFSKERYVQDVKLYKDIDQNDVLVKEESQSRSIQPVYKYSKDAWELKPHKQIVEKYYEKRKKWKTSNLGSILFKNVQPYVFYKRKRQNKKYLILIWKYWNWLRFRHVYNFQRRRAIEPDDDINWEHCSVNNCIISGDDKDFDEADAVVIHMQRAIAPNVTVRNPNQRWIFLNDESPFNVFSLSQTRPPPLKNFSELFNWTMTYRTDSDIPVPYGRTIPLPEPLDVNLDDSASAVRQLVPFWDKKQFTTLAVVMISNCDVKSRLRFISILGSYVNLDVIGKCSKILDVNSTQSCPGHFRSDCEVVNKYIFYLVLENSKCRQYLTEKVFHHAYAKGAIPIIMGAPLEDCKKLLPPHSFLHVDNYDAPEELAMHMLDIAGSYDNLLKYHRWRKHFAAVGEHGYFRTRSYHYCRVCEALNYNDDARNIYHTDDLQLYFDPKLLCDMDYANTDPF